MRASRLDQACSPFTPDRLAFGLEKEGFLLIEEGVCHFSGGSVIGVVFNGVLAHTVVRWGGGSFLVRWRTRPVSERWLLQEVCDFLSSHGRPKRTRKPWKRGERVSGQDVFPRLELRPPRQMSLPHLVELLEPPPACPFAGRSAQGSSACHHPRSSHEASGAPRMARR